MERTNSAAEIGLLLAMLDDAFDGKAWHGPNLRGTLRRLSAGQALWRPGKGRHCIAEIAVHCAYWKYASRRRLRGDARGGFFLKGSNWFPAPAALDEAEWKRWVAALDAEHAALREAVAAFPPRQLAVVPPGSKVNNRKLIYGIASHDVYHAGQIRLIKSLMG